MVRRLTLPSRISEPGGGEGGDLLVRESLSELSNLLEKGEKQGIFSSKMPPLIGMKFSVFLLNMLGLE